MNMETSLDDYLSDAALLTCLAELRAKQCAKRHADAQFDRYFKRTDRPVRSAAENASCDDPGTYLPGRRLWSRAPLARRKKAQPGSLAKLAILRFAQGVRSRGELEKWAWGRRFLGFAGRVRARAASGELSFAQPASFAIHKPGKEDRFVTSFRNLEDKVILRQVAKYLRRLFDARLSDDCYSFRQDGSVDHTTAVKALVAFRREHAGETLFVAECDIRKFFDVIDHDVARRAFARMAKGMDVDPRAVRAVDAYLAAYTSTETLLAGASERGRPACAAYVARIRDALSALPDGARGRAVGIPQGGALSGLIANWVLDEADRHVRRGGADRAFYARYCDDIVIVHADRHGCRLALARYLRAMKRLRLPVHPPAGRIPYGPGFFDVKSKHPYAWRAIPPRRTRSGQTHGGKLPGARGAAPWVGFLGNQVNPQGEVRVRRDSVDRHLLALRQACRRILGLCHAVEDDASGIVLRKGSRKNPVTLAGAARAMLKACVSKGVGYLRAGPFAASSVDVGWMAAFPDVCGHDAELQLRGLDAARPRLFFPVRKLAGLEKGFFGRPMSYYGYLVEADRPGVGRGRTRRRGWHGGYAGL